MNTRQFNKLSMYLAVQGICDGNPTAWQPVQAFSDAYTDLKTHVANIQTFNQSQEQANTGIAQDKHAAREAMCALALPIASAVHAFAVKTKNHTLAATVDFSMSELMGGRDVQSRDYCQNIVTVAGANLPSLASYGVTAAKIGSLTGAIAAYNALISKPRDTRAQGKTVTTNLQAEFYATDLDLKIMDDLTWQIGNPTFVSNYKNARIIVDAAASHASPTPPTPSPAPPQP